MNRILRLSRLINKQETPLQAQTQSETKTKTIQIQYNSEDITSFQGNYTDDDINELLKEFNIVNNVEELKVGNEVRYYTFITKNGIEHKVFRLGGTIYEIDFIDKYMVVCNGKFTWKLKFGKNIFYKKIDIFKIKKYYESEINNIESEKMEIVSEKQNIEHNYNKLKKNQKLLMSKAQELIENVKELQNQNEQLDLENKYLKKIIKKKLNNNLN